MLILHVLAQAAAEMRRGVAGGRAPRRRGPRLEARMAGRLQDKIAIIFGAGSVGPGWGNGKCTALTFAREGAKVAVVDINRAAAEEKGVKVSFFGAIAFGRVGEPDFTDDGVLLVASFDDLMATKVKVVLQRAEAKDYSDVAAMVNAGVSLSRGLASARRLYGPNFQPSESLKALVYFNDGDLNTLTADEKKTLVEAVRVVRDLPDVELRSTSLSGR